MDQAHTTLRSHLVCARVKIPVQGDAKLGHELDQFFTSAQVGFLPHIRTDQISTRTGLQFSMTLPRQEVIEDGLDYSDERHDATMHLSASVAITTLRELLQRRSSQLVEFRTQENAAYLYGTEHELVFWTGTSDIPQLWRSLTQLDTLVTTAIAQPERVSFEDMLRATHFCAAASQL